MRRSLIRSALLAFALAVVPGASAWGQENHGTPTRANTPIVNTAKVTYSDANNNEYKEEKAITLRVALVRAVTIASGDHPNKIESPGKGYTIKYTLENHGNDLDIFQLAFTAPLGVKLVGFSFDGADPTWTTVADFNTKLLDYETDYKGNAGPDPQNPAAQSYALEFYLHFDVEADQEGPIELEVKVQPKDDPDEEKTDKYMFTPDPAYGLSVAAKDTTQTNLPSGKTGAIEYEALFTVKNTGSGEDFEWTVEVAPGTKITIVKVEKDELSDGTLGSRAGAAPGDLTLGYNESMIVKVTYTIATDAAAGMKEKIKLEVKQKAPGTAEDADETEVTVIRPTLVVTKEAYKDDQATKLNAATDQVENQQEFWYLITISNSSADSHDATSVEVTDQLPPMLEFLTAKTPGGVFPVKENHIGDPSTPGGAWKISYEPSDRTITAIPVVSTNDHTSRPLAPGEKFSFWIPVKLK